jgi:ABC-2 type transport system ATP-binding protein
MSPASVLQVRDLRKAFGRVQAVRGINFEVRAGELVGLVGPNGAGKSTTIQMISGQLLPDSGQIVIGGVDVLQDPNGARSKVGYVPEEPKLYDYLSAREMVAFVARIRGVGSELVDLALEGAGLGADSERLIREYSQGMRRRTALACALVAKPPLLILDESLNGLDPPSADRTVRILRAACEAGAGVILSTHVLETLERAADRILMIRAGEVIADAPAHDTARLRGLFEEKGLPR